MKPMSIVAAGVGGVAGALIWAAISYFTNLLGIATAFRVGSGSRKDEGVSTTG